MNDLTKPGRVARAAAAAGLTVALASAAHAQQAATPQPAAPQPVPPAASAVETPATATAAADKPEPLVIYFDTASVAIRPQDYAILDKASRLYSAAKPLVMIVSGGTDAVGSAQANLNLSQRRAEAVLRGLVARGIPPDRFQVLAKGETEPAVATQSGVAEPRNRRVEIAWR